MKHLVLFLMLAFLGACKNCPECPPPEECPPCPDTLECPVGWDLQKSELKWECVEPAPPPGDAQPADYVNLDRVPSIVHNLEIELAYMIWQAHRDPLYVVGYCPWVFEEQPTFFPFTLAEMEAWANSYPKLQSEAAYMVSNLPVVNKRCEEGNAFCGRSNVRKERLNEFMNKWESAKFISNDLRVIAGTDPILATCPYDSIIGWCECRNAARVQ